MLRDEKCVICGKDSWLQVSHIIPKKPEYSAGWYATENVLLMCRGCHIFKWHKDPLFAYTFLVERFGSEFIKRVSMYRTRIKVDYQAIFIKLQIEMKALLGNGKV